jgi:hypothetical protein
MKDYYAIPTSQELINTLFELIQQDDKTGLKEELVAYWQITEKNFGLIATFEVFARLCQYHAGTNY